MSILLQGGDVVSGHGAQRLDVRIEGEKITAVGTGLSAGDAQVVDCAGKLLFPGFLDGHTHFDLEVCGTITADGFASGGRAALRGGHHHGGGLRRPGQGGASLGRSCPLAGEGGGPVCL